VSDFLTKMTSISADSITAAAIDWTHT